MPNPLSASAISKFTETTAYNSSGETSITESQIEASIAQVTSFMHNTNYKPLPVSTFDLTLQRIESLFGTHWSKEPFGKTIVPVAIGVVNDMYRSPNCTQYHPDHWTFAAVHYAICSYLSENPTDDTEIAKGWRSWTENGVRWWINFEKMDNSPKFDPFPILTELLDNVYTHIDKDSKVYSLLLNESLRTFQNSEEPTEPLTTTEFEGGKLSDDSECAAFSVDTCKSIPALHQTILSKSITEVRYLVEVKNFDLQELRYDDASPLFVAAEKGDNEIVQYIIEQAKAKGQLEQLNKAKSSGATPLHVAAFMGHEEVVKTLLEEGVNVDTTLFNQNSPLYDAINQGHPAIADLLLAKDANARVLCINGGVCMHAAAYSNSADMIEKLHNAANDQLEARKAPHGETPLHIAAQEGNLDAVKKLIELGANVAVSDFRFGCFQHENSSGLTPWHYAVFKKNADLLAILLDSGALPDMALLQQPELNRQYQSMIRPSNNQAAPANGVLPSAPLPVVDKQTDSVTLPSISGANGQTNPTPLPEEAENGLEEP
eukprot:CAMPEP_0206186594 /NCGR_PEP_ID=MMETSP0166-20121206/2495_1 /ASSEMBLY_ACC=CAM_ASM_000260 /TAXON_ID=95228 /ORGANISM="Vannella robusta, Strain DIVA3 518/3/11/1/6" /LENGTH=544 /DNA_ID=CAMNT_0053602007 /DNA_START=1330 /DNA_END=2961 /DNA_ORIENTATION=+